ncbi:MAG: hypothetical protein WD269_05135 [Acidimicrobiia bacterium]
MAKYAAGYVIVMLVAAIALLFGLGFQGVAVGPREVIDGGGVPPVPAPPPLPKDDGGEANLPLIEMVVVDVNGKTALSPISYCFEGDGVAVCADGILIAGEEPSFISTAEQPVQLAFSMDWSVTVEMAPTDGACGFSTTEYGVVPDVVLDTLGPAGTYQVQVMTSGPGGDAHWVIMIENQSDLASIGEDC